MAEFAHVGTQCVGIAITVVCDGLHCPLMVVADQHSSQIKNDCLQVLSFVFPDGRRAKYQRRRVVIHTRIEYTPIRFECG